MEPAESPRHPTRPVSVDRLHLRREPSGTVKPAEAGSEDGRCSPAAVRPPARLGYSRPADGVARIWHSSPDPLADDSRAEILGDLVAEEIHLDQCVVASRMPGDAEDVTADTYLRLLAVRAAIVRIVDEDPQTVVREAMEAGATWEEIADARSTSPGQARSDFVRWVEVQAVLWDSTVIAAGARLGLPPEHCERVRALAEQR